MAMCTAHLRSLSPSHRRSLVVLLASLIILRSRIFTAPKDVLAKLNVVARGSKLTAEDLNNVLQQLYITEADGSRTLLVPYRNEYLSKVSVSPAEVLFLGDRSCHLHSNALCLVGHECSRHNTGALLGEHHLLITRLSGAHSSHTAVQIQVGCTLFPAIIRDLQIQTQHRRYIFQTTQSHSLPHHVSVLEV
jgi:hypothetical protein